MEIKNKLVLFTLIMTIIIQYVSYAAENELLSLKKNIEDLRFEEDPFLYLLAKDILSANVDEIKDFDTFNRKSQERYQFSWTINESTGNMEILDENLNKDNYFSHKDYFLENNSFLKYLINLHDFKLNTVVNTNLYLYKIKKENPSFMKKICSRSPYVLVTAACIPLSFYVTNPMAVIGAIPWTIGYFALQKTNLKLMMDTFSRSIRNSACKKVKSEYDDVMKKEKYIPWGKLTKQQLSFLIDRKKRNSWRYKSFNSLILLTKLASLGLSMYGVNKILLYFKVGWYADARRYCSVHIVNPTKKFISDTVLLNLANIFKESSANIVTGTYDPIIKGK